jgi:prepilin-type N-terminal cleavage/methylation domain-containing protein
MKLLKNKRGFTLVELLAVIVVLAILMLIATNNVLPMIEKAKKGAFATTANQLLDSAMNMQMYLNLSSASANDNSLCTTPDNLIANNYVDKITTSSYTGTIYIGREADGKYKKELCIVDVKNAYYICGDFSAKVVNADDVKTGTASFTDTFNAITVGADGTKTTTSLTYKLDPSAGTSCVANS